MHFKKAFATFLLICQLQAEVDAHEGCSAKRNDKSTLESVQTRIQDIKTKDSWRKTTQAGCVGCITVDTHAVVFHCTNGDNTQVDQAKVDEQMAVVNADFSKSPFKFNLLSTRFVVDDTYCKVFNSLDEDNPDGVDHTEDIGNKYRRGDMATLNLYFGGSETSSEASFPHGSAVDENGVVSGDDGAWVAIDTMPDGDSECCDLGKTATHEIGHWLGLEHTFGDGDEDADVCSVDNPGDYVDDTPAGRVTEFDCPVGKDTCTNIAGLDPIRNFMDYSSDECYEEFSKGQMERMYYIWSLFRKNQETCASGQSIFELEFVGDDSEDEMDVKLESTDGSVTEKFVSSGVEFLCGTEKRLMDVCINSSKSYVFSITDSGEDGIESPGYYSLRLNGKTLRENSSSFGALETTNFDGNGGDTTDGGNTDSGDTDGGNTDGNTTDTTGGIDIESCFPGSSTVLVQSQGKVPMSELKLGDHVLTAGGKFERVYSFGHLTTDTLFEYVKVDAGNGASIELSKDHIILANGEDWVPSEMLQVGDMLVTGEGLSIAVTNLSTVVRQGAFAPLTKSGTIVVDGILASNYISLQKNSGHLVVGSFKTPLSYHWILHTFQSVQRIASNFLLDSTETYTNYGISNWISFPLTTVYHMLNIHPAVAVVAFLPVMIVCSAVRLVEQYAMVVAVLAAIVVRRLYQAPGNGKMKTL